MDDRQAALLTEQLSHANHLLQSQIKALEARLAFLEEDVRDHEKRIRSATEGVTQFKLFSGLASGGSGLMSLAALLRTFLGG